MSNIGFHEMVPQSTYHFCQNYSKKWVSIEIVNDSTPGPAAPQASTLEFQYANEVLITELATEFHT